MEVTVLVCTYGDESWKELAERAAASAEVPVIKVHGKTLAGARNEAARLATTEWIIYLDADDELEPGYVEAMATGKADLRAPAVRYVAPYRQSAPYVPRVVRHLHKQCRAECLKQGNWMVIGTAVRRQMVLDVGGWREYPVNEDWDLWQRCWLSGATVEAIPSAIYRAHVRPNSRNRATSQDVKRAVHREVVARNLGR